ARRENRRAHHPLPRGGRRAGRPRRGARPRTRAGRRYARGHQEPRRRQARARDHPPGRRRSRAPARCRARPPRRRVHRAPHHRSRSHHARTAAARSRLDRPRGHGRQPGGSVPRAHRGLRRNPSRRRYQRRRVPRSPPPTAPRPAPPRRRRTMTTGTYPTGTPAATTAVKRSARPNLARVLWIESRTEFVKLLRLPAYSVATLAFPLMFYLVFGAAYGRFEAQGIDMPTYLVATFGAGGVLSASLFSFGAGVASERAQGWMLLKRVSPMPPVAYFFAKTVMAMAFAVLVIVLITLLGMLTQGVRIEALAWLRMLGTLLTGVFPFAALGLAFGYLFGPNS